MLKRNPDHPGANHYYIHAVEASPHPERGAARPPTGCATLVPGAGHLVHMPSHIYLRVGLYHEASPSTSGRSRPTRRTSPVQRRRASTRRCTTRTTSTSSGTAASMEGRRPTRSRGGARSRPSIDRRDARRCPTPSSSRRRRALALVRFGQWDEVLALAAAGDGLTFATAMWHYARGLALAAKDEADGARPSWPRWQQRWRPRRRRSWTADVPGAAVVEIAPRSWRARSPARRASTRPGRAAGRGGQAAGRPAVHGAALLVHADAARGPGPVGRQPPGGGGRLPRGPEAEPGERLVALRPHELLRLQYRRSGPRPA